MGVGWAGEQHAEAYAKLPGVELAGIAGLEEPVRTELATRLGVERHVATWEELFEDDSLDVVSVAVPTFLHAPITIAALERGLHVLCEKPIARTPDEAAAMVAAARAAGRVLDVAFNRRQRTDIQALRRFIEAGRLGQPYYTKAWWLRRTGIPTLGSWFTDRETAGGGPLVDLGIHVLDYALFLLGQPNVTTVSASTYDLLGTAGFGDASISGKSGGSGRRSTSRTWRARSCASTTAARCSSRRAGPRTACPAWSSGSRSTAPRAARSCAWTSSSAPAR